MTEWMDFAELFAIIGGLWWVRGWSKDVEHILDACERKFNDLEGEIATLRDIVLEKEDAESKKSDS